jgi:hypothetical protein
MDLAHHEWSSTATSALRHAHERLGRDLCQAARSARAGEPDARVRFAACRRALERQLESETVCLLALLDSCGADTTRLRRDHAALGELVERAQHTLDGGVAADFCDVVQELMVGLCAHSIREERELRAYATTIGDAGAARLAVELERFAQR